MLYIILLGPPGAGKGTQARLLAGTLGIPQISSGDLFRENLRGETELGLLAKAYMDRGELVPDDVTVRMVMEWLSHPDGSAELAGAREGGAILDGFPRTLAQAAALDEALSHQGHEISAALLIQVSDETVIERLSGRWICRDCQAMYHTLFNPPREPGRCDECGGPLYQRPDDQPHTVRNRLLVYYKQTAPLVGYYFAHGILMEIDGEQGIEAVQADLMAAVRGDDHP
jgi:adenylate kinase